MRRWKRGSILIVSAAAGFVIAAGAGSYSVGRSAEVPRGQSANFLPSNWFCRNLGASIKCQKGDAFPNVTLTTLQKGGVTVKVHTLRDPQGGRVTRSDEKGYPVYIFTAL